jgi:hypothetical protein
MLPSFSPRRRIVFTELLPSNGSGIYRQTHRLLFDTTQTRRVQKFFYCFVCIRGRSNVYTEVLLKINKGLHIQTHRLMGRIYEVGR